MPLEELLPSPFKPDGHHSLLCTDLTKYGDQSSVISKIYLEQRLKLHVKYDLLPLLPPGCTVGFVLCGVVQCLLVAVANWVGVLLGSSGLHCGHLKNCYLSVEHAISHTQADGLCVFCAR